MRLNFPSGFTPGDAENFTRGTPCDYFRSSFGEGSTRFSLCVSCHFKYWKGDLVDLDVTPHHHPLNLLAWFVYTFKA